MRSLHCAVGERVHFEAPAAARLEQEMIAVTEADGHLDVSVP
jgi:hypothetical protein